MNIGFRRKIEYVIKHKCMAIPKELLLRKRRLWFTLSLNIKLNLRLYIRSSADLPFLVNLSPTGPGESRGHLAKSLYLCKCTHWRETRLGNKKYVQLNAISLCSLPSTGRATFLTGLAISHPNIKSFRQEGHCDRIA